MAKKVTTDAECSVFIGNIDPRVSEEILWELFLQAGPIKSIHIPCDKESGKQKAFAFLEFTSSASAHYAWELLDGIKLYNRSLTVRPQSFNSGETVNHMPSNVLPANKFYDDFYKKYDDLKRRPQSEPRRNQWNEESNYQRNSSFSHPTINRSLSYPVNVVDNTSTPWQPFNVVPFTSTPCQSLPLRIPHRSSSSYAGSPLYSRSPSSEMPYWASPYGYTPTRQNPYHR